MKVLILSLILGAAVLVAGCSSNDHSTPEARSTAQGDYYTCPMHPSVISDHPGACPICGMALVRKSAIAGMTAQEIKSLELVSLSPTQQVLANVSTTTAERHPLVKSITVSGTVAVPETRQATVTARFSGRIEQLLVNVTGERVRKDQPLLTLYSPDLVTAQQEYLLALEHLRSARTSGDSSLTRTQQELLRASRERLVVHFGLTDQQVRALEQSRAVHSTLTFDSPITGTVLTKSVVAGQYVNEGTVLYEISDLSRSWVYLDVYEQDLRWLRLGMPVTVASVSDPGAEEEGVVSFIEPTVNQQTRTVRARAEFRSQDANLLPGMFVEARLQAKIESTLTVPVSAVLWTGTRSVVWVEVRPGAFEPRDVVTGAQSGSEIQILRGLKDGDRVAATGGFLIDSESQLEAPLLAAESGTAAASAAPASAARDTEDVTIVVRNGYAPSTIRVRAGQLLRLHFFRDEDVDCTREVIFSDFGIRRELPAHQTTTIELRPTQAGTFRFSCGMDMVEGSLVVLDKGAGQ